MTDSFGHSNNFATLSHSSDKGYTYFNIRAPAHNIQPSMHSAMGGRIVFIPLRDIIYLLIILILNSKNNNEDKVSHAIGSSAAG